ncbi:MAG: phosphohydrolase [Clostridiales bacterium]|nr:phosphohydrolase [Clostridiales bacterium]
MQFVKTADLKPGMRLAKPIYNKMGVLLYERDTNLTVQGINSIENFGLIGIFILEPAEPVPPLSKEDLEFEQFQTIYMFKIKENLDRLQANQPPVSLLELVKDIQSHYGLLDHKLNFAQTLRSSADFVYKHAISVAILSALIANQMHVPEQEQAALITASLLYDFGYLYVPQSVLDKGDNLTGKDKEFIQLNLERGYETLRPQYQTFDLPEPSLEIIQQAIFCNSTTLKVKEPASNIKLLADILKVADKFDRLTAMNINKPPISEVAAMTHLRSQRDIYNSLVLAALAQCIHILPTGACVDLSDGEKALVLEENPANFSHPMILKFSNNLIYDLSDPAINKNLKIVDIMKTMDNRIAIDEHTLEHFVADAYIKETADRFRKKKLESAQQRQSELKKQAMDSLMDSATVLSSEEEMNPVKKPRKKMKLL